MLEIILEIRVIIAAHRYENFCLGQEDPAHVTGSASVDLDTSPLDGDGALQVVYACMPVGPLFRSLVLLTQARGL